MISWFCLLQSKEKSPRSVNLNVIAKMTMMNICDIPSEVLVKICANLEFKDLCNLELASQHFRYLSFSVLTEIRVYICRCLIVEHQLYRQLLYSLTDYMMVSNIPSEVVEISEDHDNVIISRMYKSLLVQHFRPDHYHCKGNYGYYMQVKFAVHTDPEPWGQFFFTGQPWNQ